jgi:hypothetical protein
LSLRHNANLGAVYTVLAVSLNWVLRIILEPKREDREDYIEELHDFYSVNIIRVMRYWKMVRAGVAAFVGKIQKV